MVEPAPPAWPQCVLVRSTYGSEDAARTMARKLIDARLAACTHVHEAEAAYVWDAAVVEEVEWLLEARCLPELAAAVCEAVGTEHPYDLPVIEQLPSRVSPAYFAWMREQAR